MHEHACGRKKSPVLAQIVVRRKTGGAKDVVFEKDDGAAPGNHPPRIAGRLLPYQRAASAVHRLEIRNVAGEIQDAIIAGGPLRHLIILQGSAQPVSPHADVKDVGRGVLHGDGKGDLHRGERVRGESKKDQRAGKHACKSRIAPGAVSSDREQNVATDPETGIRGFLGAEKGRLGWLPKTP